MIKKLLITTLCAGLLFSGATIKTKTARAAALEGDNIDVNQLFSDVGTELVTLNEDFTFSPGAKGEYLAEFDEEGNCTKSGFKMLETGDNILNKNVYVYYNEFPIVLQTNKLSLTHNQSVLTFDYKIDGSSKESYNLTCLEESLYVINVDFEGLTEEDAIVTTATFCAQYAGQGPFSPAYIYYEVEELEDNVEDSTESTEDTIFDKANNWTNDTFGLSLSTSAFGSIILIVGLVLLFKRK